MVVFLDLEDCPIDRAEFRRTVKYLSKIPIYSHKQGRIIYFNIKDQAKVESFLQNLQKIFAQEGFKTVRI